MLVCVNILFLKSYPDLIDIFVFSDIFELNREKIKEGKSVIITLFKNFNDIEKRTRINVKKIIPLDEIINKFFTRIYYTYLLRSTK